MIPDEYRQVTKKATSWILVVLLAFVIAFESTSRIIAVSKGCPTNTTDSIAVSILKDTDLIHKLE